MGAHLPSMSEVVAYRVLVATQQMPHLQWLFKPQIVVGSKVGAVALWSRALTAIVKDPCLIPSSHRVAHSHL